MREVSLFILFLFHVQISQTVWSPHTVERSLQDSCLAFLRSACTMAFLCYDVEIPQVQVSAFIMYTYFFNKNLEVVLYAEKQAQFVARLPCRENYGRSTESRHAP